MARRTRNDPTRVALRSAATAFKAQEAMGAAASVIAARTGLAAMMSYANPTAESNAELGKMVTEKVAAFSEAGAAAAAGAATLASQGARYAAGEAAAAQAGLARLAACRTPVEAFAVQGSLMADFMTRGMAYSMGLNALAARTGERVLAPVHRTVTANDKRLKGR